MTILHFAFHARSGSTVPAMMQIRFVISGFEDDALMTIEQANPAVLPRIGETVAIKSPEAELLKATVSDIEWHFAPWLRGATVTVIVKLAGVRL